MLISKDTKFITSLSASPSNFGTRFFNFLFQELKLDYLHKPFATLDIEGAITGMRALGIHASPISMPHKEKVMQFVDVIDSAALRIGAVNTLLNKGGKIYGFNTDYLGVRELIHSKNLNPADYAVVLRGSGGMARAVLYALKDEGFADVFIWARNSRAAHDMNSGLDYKISFSDAFNFTEITKKLLLINCTPLGMQGTEFFAERPFSAAALDQSAMLIDVVAKPAETDFLKEAKALGKMTINGGEIVLAQAIHQFKIYTGIDLPMEVAKKASVFANS